MALPFDLPRGLAEPLTNLRGEALRLYDRYRDLIPPGLARVVPAVGGRSPTIDLYETPDALVLRADLPGVPPSAVELAIEGQAVILKGEVPGPASRGPGWAFSRRIDLGCDVDADLTRADLRDGVLEVIIPKARASRPRTIPVRAG